VHDREEKLEALGVLVERLAPGRSDDARGPSAKELRATEVVAVAIDEASAKIRTGPPADAAADYSLPVWAGVVPFGLLAGSPVPDERCSVPVPDYVAGWTPARA
jgi:hypothetical protein